MASTQRMVPELERMARDWVAAPSLKYRTPFSNSPVLTPVAADRLKDISERYPPGWFGEALGEAVKAGARNLKYIEAILERWEVEGFKAPKKGAEGEQRPGKGVRPKPTQGRRRTVTRIRGD